MKISPKLINNVQKYALKAGDSTYRYLTKNTVNARYNRHMDGAACFGLAGFIHALNADQYTPTNIMTSVALFSTAYINAAAALVNRVQLRPIKKRAKSIRKAAKLAEKNAKKAAQENGINKESVSNKILKKPKVILQNLKNKFSKK